MKEQMFSGIHQDTGPVLFCVCGDKVVQSTDNGPSDTWRKPESFIGFTYWPCFDYEPEKYSNVELVWERETWKKC